MAAYLQLGLNHVICCDHKFQFRSRLFSEPTLHCPLLVTGPHVPGNPSPGSTIFSSRLHILPSLNNKYISPPPPRIHHRTDHDSLYQRLPQYRPIFFFTPTWPVCCKKVALANLVFIHNAWGCHPGTERGWCQMVTCTNTGLMNTPPPTLMVVKSSHG